jgi:hypothetical protein
MSKTGNNEQRCCSICLMSSEDDDEEKLERYCLCGCAWRHPTCLQRWLRARSAASHSHSEQRENYPPRFPYARYEWSGTASQLAEHCHSRTLVILTLMEYLFGSEPNRDPRRRLYFGANENDLASSTSLAAARCDVCRAAFQYAKLEEQPSLSILQQPHWWQVVSYIIVVTIANAWQSFAALAVFSLLTMLGYSVSFTALAMTFFSMFGVSAITIRLNETLESDWLRDALLDRFCLQFDTPDQNPNHARDLQFPFHDLFLAGESNWRCLLLHKYVLPNLREIPTFEYNNKYASILRDTQQLYVLNACEQSDLDQQNNNSQSVEAVEEDDAAMNTVSFLNYFIGCCTFAFFLEWLLSRQVCALIEFSLGTETLALIDTVVLMYVLVKWLWRSLQFAVYDWIRLAIVPRRFAPPRIDSCRRQVVPL